MAKTGSNNVLGLYVGPNQLEGPQDGAYSTLQNCLIKDKGVIGPRFGVTPLNTAFGGSGTSARVNVFSPSSTGTGLLGYGYVHSGTGTSAAVYPVLSSTAVLSNVPAPESWLRTRFADSRGRCYFTADGGLKRIDSDSTGAAAGGLEAFLGGGAMAQTAYDSSGFLAINYAVLYRAALVRKDYLKREIVGPGSGRAILRTAPQRTAGVGGVVRNANLVTVTTTASHGFKVGQSVYATFAAGDTDPNEFDNGLKVITSVPSSTTFTYDETDSNYTSLSTATYDSGPATCTLTVYLDDNAAAGDILRLYRSEQVTPWTATPPEDVYQVYEAILTSTDISNGYKAVTDNTPEVLLGDPAYFSPSVEGDAGNNGKPPRAVDVCAVGGGLILSNLRYPHVLELRLLATGGSAGVVDATTITITDGTSPFTMTGETGTISAGEFPVYSGESVARDIEKTAQALVDAINTYASNTIVNAYYVSGADDPPGMIRLEKRDYSTTGFTVVSDKGTAWAPQILNTGTSTASTQESAVSSCSESKPGLPDAHPLLSRYEVGEPNEKALRVLAIRDNKAIIIKERSTWLRSGIWPNIRLDQIDDTLTFAFPNSAAALDGTVYALSSQGVVAINESGVSSVGAPIAAITEYLEDEELNFATASVWGVVDKALGAYLLFMGTEENPDSNSRAYVYSPSARAWSGPWMVDWTAYGRSLANGLAVVGLADMPRIAEESPGYGGDVYRNALTVATQPTSTTLTFADTSMMSVGDMLLFGYEVGPSSTTRRWVITAISGTTVTLNVSHGSVFTPGSSTVSLVRGFECIAEPVPLHAGGNGNDAQVSGVVLLMDKEAFESADISVAGGDVGQEYQSAKTLSRWGWGEGTWGGSDNDEPWGGYDGIRPERAAVPLESQRAPFHQVRLTVREAGAKWRLHGVQLELEPGGIKGRR